MRRPLRSAFILGVLAGLVLALARALARDARPTPAPLPAPPAPLPAVTPPARTPVPVEIPEPAPAEPAQPSQPAPPAEPVIRSDGEPSDPITGSSWVEPVDGGCPDGYPIKAKTSSGIFHRPGGLSYERTKPDRCYADEASAEADGFRAAKR